MAMARRRDGRSRAKLKCPSCNKSYRYLKHLKRHQLWHTGQRPFECDICTASFSRSDCLKRHRRSCVHRHEAGLPPIEQKFSQQKPQYLLPQMAGPASPGGMGSDAESTDGLTSTSTGAQNRPRRARRLRASTLRRSYAEERDSSDTEAGAKPAGQQSGARVAAARVSIASGHDLANQEDDEAEHLAERLLKREDPFPERLQAPLEPPLQVLEDHYTDCSTDHCGTNISSSASSPLVDSSSFNTSIETAGSQGPSKYEDCIKYQQEPLHHVTEWLQSPERHPDEVFTPPGCYSGDFGINDPFFQSFVKPSPEPVIRVDDNMPAAHPHHHHHHHAQYNPCSELSGAVMAYEMPTLREDGYDNNSSSCAYPQDSSRYENASWTIPFYSHSSLYH